MTNRLERWGAVVDDWRWPASAPLGLALGVGVGVVALWVDGLGGVVVGAVAAAGFGWLAVQGQPRTVVLDEDSGGWLVRVERWASRRAEEDWARARRWWRDVQELVGEVVRRRPERGPDPEVPGEAGVPGEPGEELPPAGAADARPVLGTLVNLGMQTFVFADRRVLDGNGGTLELRKPLAPSDARMMANQIERGVVHWYGPDLPGFPPNPLAREELEDGPPLNPRLFARRQQRDPLRAVREPTEAWDTLGPMMDLPGGRLVSESYPEGAEIEPFRVMVLPVTEHQWAEVMGERRGPWGFGQAPVTRVSWFDAVAFCNRASERAGYRPAYDAEGRWLPEADGYRLPTDAEWEWACRAGTTTAFHWGDDDAVADAYAWFGGNAGDRAHAVGRKRPNPWGLYDLTGNVWEWCTSAVDGGRVVDSPPALSTKEVVRALRGGAFFNWTGGLRSSLRNWFEPSGVNGNVGFRCVRGVRRQSVVDP